MIFSACEIAALSMVAEKRPNQSNQAKGSPWKTGGWIFGKVNRRCGGTVSVLSWRALVVLMDAGSKAFSCVDVSTDCVIPKGLVWRLFDNGILGSKVVDENETALVNGGRAVESSPWGWCEDDEGRSEVAAAGAGGSFQFSLTSAGSFESALVRLTVEWRSWRKFNCVKVSTREEMKFA